MRGHVKNAASVTKEVGRARGWQIGQTAGGGVQCAGRRMLTRGLRIISKPKSRCDFFEVIKDVPVRIAGQGAQGKRCCSGQDSGCSRGWIKLIDASVAARHAVRMAVNGGWRRGIAAGDVPNGLARCSRSFSGAHAAGIHRMNDRRSGGGKSVELIGGIDGQSLVVRLGSGIECRILVPCQEIKSRQQTARLACHIHPSGIVHSGRPDVS